MLPDWVEDHARSLEAQQPRMPAVYLVRRDRLLSGEAADAIRELYTGAAPAEKPYTVRELARELDAPVAWVDGYVASLLDSGKLVVWLDRGVLSPAAVLAVRALHRAEQSPDTTVGYLARELAVTHYVVQAHAAKQGSESEVYLTRGLFRGDSVLSGAAADGVRRSVRAERAARMSADTSSTPGAPSTPDPEHGRPVRVVDLALELDVRPSELRRRARDLFKSPSELMGAVYLDYTTGLLTAYAADRLRGFTPLAVLARELGVLPSDVGRAARDLERALEVQGGGPAVYGAGRLLTPFAADRLRELVRDDDVPSDPDVPRDGERARCSGCGTGIRYQDCPTGGWWVHDVHPADGHDAEPRPVPGGPVGVVELAGELGVQTFEVAREARPVPGDPVRVSAEPLFWGSLSGRGLEDIASLLILQELALAEEGIGPWTAGADVPDTSVRDMGVLRWAVSVAGHLFDQHMLWDYDLVPDAEHVHRCIGHRHYGPRTRLGADPRG